MILCKSKLECSYAAKCGTVGLVIIISEVLQHLQQSKPILTHSVNVELPVVVLITIKIPTLHLCYPSSLTINITGSLVLFVDSGSSALGAATQQACCSCFELLCAKKSWVSELYIRELRAGKSFLNIKITSWSFKSASVNISFTFTGVCIYFWWFCAVRFLRIISFSKSPLSNSFSTHEK